MLRALTIAAAVLALGAPAAAWAHDDDDDGGSYYGYAQHAWDHAEHGDYHRDEAYAHAEAHERGFYGPGDHAYWHYGARQAHRQFHYDHPHTWHDHYGWRRQDGYEYPNYGGYYGYGYGGY